VAVAGTIPAVPHARIAANGRGPASSSTPASPISASAPTKAELEAIPVISSTSALRTTVGKTESFGHYVPKDGAVQPARLLTNINPEYPAEAKRDGLSGSVELHFKIGITGDVHDINVVKGPLVLAQAAVEAVRGRRYKPARVDGVPAETDASAVFDFKLN